MTEREFYFILLYAFAGLAAAVFIALLFIAAPYGRHARPGGGPRVNATAGWVVMEAPAVLGFAACFLCGAPPVGAAQWVFLSLWELHYVHRAFVFPFRRRGGQQTMPAAIMASAFLFNCINSYLNGRYLAVLAGPYAVAWLADPRCMAGTALFLAGLGINRQSDRILFRLRPPGDAGYHIPRGGLYRYVSCPNYLGEMVEWFGFALLTWSPAALVFALWTVANLLPRALAHHRWYRARFPDYPPERKAVIPFVL